MDSYGQVWLVLEYQNITIIVTTTAITIIKNNNDNDKQPSHSLLDTPVCLSDILYFQFKTSSLVSTIYYANTKTLETTNIQKQTNALYFNCN